MSGALAPTTIPIVCDVSQVFGAPTWLTDLTRVGDRVRLGWVGAERCWERKWIPGIARPDQLGFEVEAGGATHRASSHRQGSSRGIAGCWGHADLELDAGSPINSLKVAFSPTRVPWAPDDRRSMHSTWDSPGPRLRRAWWSTR